MASQNSIVLACAVAGAALFAALRPDPLPAHVADAPLPPVESLGPSGGESDDEELPPDHPPVPGAGTRARALDEGSMGDELPPNHPPVPGLREQPKELGEGSTGDVLPPNHPPIEGASSASSGLGVEGEKAAAIVWQAPAKWTTSPSASPMRLATYRVPAAPGAAGEAELTVVRAGGSTEANLERWVQQFTDSEKPRRTQKVVNGRKVVVLEVSGTFQGGAMGSKGSAVPRPGWSLEGAVVETEGEAYFFKLTGPTASVRAARADFDALLGSIASAASGATH